MDPQRVRVYQVEALVLRQQDYAEADRILTLATVNGKLRAVAKGVRRSASHKAGHLDLFMRAELQLAKGRNLDIITQAECRESFDHLRTDSLRFSYACYVAELLEAVLREDEQREIYHLAVDTMRRIDSAANPAVWVRYYDLRLLGFTGFQPDLFACVRCHREILPETNYLSFEMGGMVCAGCHLHNMPQVSLNAQKLLRFLQRANPAEVTRLSVMPATLLEAERLLQLYWQHVLEREIKSATSVRQLQNERITASPPSSTSIPEKE